MLPKAAVSFAEDEARRLGRFLLDAPPEQPEATLRVRVERGVSALRERVG